MSEPLTAAEQIVVEAMRDDVSEAEAAQRLGWPRGRVHECLRSARDKRNVRTTRALVALEAIAHERVS
jgi:DNA-directed RNA polymerase specialized sigma24 family protein